MSGLRRHLLEMYWHQKMLVPVVCSVKLPLSLAWLQVREVDEVRPEPVDESTEGEAIPPGGGEVVLLGHVDPRIALGDLPAPGLQSSHSAHQHNSLTDQWLLNHTELPAWLGWLDPEPSPHL